MKFSILGLFAILIVAFTSCSKSESKIGDLSSDAQLIEAIQKATNKQNISASELPSTSQTVIAKEYLEDYVDAAKLAPKLGYEVDMRCKKGPRVGEYSQAYFDLKGRKLKNGKGNYPGKEDGDKGDGNKGDCFEFILPVTFEMPDGSEITIEVKEDWELIKNWYQANPDVKERPAIEFPVDVVFKDETTLTLESEEDMRRAMAECKGEEGDGDKGICFGLVLAVTYTMPDESEITVNEKEDFMLLRTWYEENPGYDEKPQLQFPVDIKWKDGTIETINNEDEMREAKAECGDGEGHGKRCFKLVYPITYVMEDGSEVTIEDKEDHMTMWQWYADHPDVKKPSLKFPVEIKNKDGTIVTINNKEEMMAAKKECGDKEDGKKRCFKLVLPVTYTMPDGTEITVESKEDRALIKAWYEVHPDVKEKPALQFPVDIEYKDRTVQTINNQDELMQARKGCKGKGKG